MIKISYEPTLPEQYHDALLALLTDCDDEFIPPLSSRESTVQKDLSPGETAAPQQDTERVLPLSYCEALLKQHFYIAVDDDRDDPEERFVGFLSYIPHHTVALSCGDVTGAYVSTIIVRKDFRCLGITRRIYGTILAEAGEPVFTRTWSTNHAHLHLLQSLGFQLIETIPDDRGPDIDTVYYIKGHD